MQLTFEQLERALAPIEKLGQEEITFPVEGNPVTLRLLTPEEENEAQKFAAVEMGDAENFVAASSFLERLKLAILSYSVIAINDQDFREGDGFIETDEVVNGKQVRIPRYLAMRKLIMRWPGAIRTAMFRKYTELLKKVEQRTQEAIQFEPSDKQAEIERLEKQLATLKAEIEPKGQVEGFSGIVKLAASVDEQESNAKLTSRIEEDVAPLKREPPAITRAPIAQRKPIIPEAAQPPVEGTLQKPLPTPVQPGPQTRTHQQDYEDESMVDLSDPEAVEQAMIRENARLMNMRKGMPVAEPPSALSSQTPRLSRPPHMEAAEVAHQFDVIDKPVEAGTYDNMAVYRMPAQDLTVDAPRVAPQGKAPVDAPEDGKRSRNPRFVPSKKL